MPLLAFSESSCKRGQISPFFWVCEPLADNVSCIAEQLESLRVACDMGEMQTVGQSQEITKMGQAVCGAAWVFHGPCLSILKRQ